MWNSAQQADFVGELFFHDKATENLQIVAITRVDKSKSGIRAQTLFNGIEQIKTPLLFWSLPMNRIIVLLELSLICSL